MIGFSGLYLFLGTLIMAILVRRSYLEVQPVLATPLFRLLLTGLGLVLIDIILRATSIIGPGLQWHDLLLPVLMSIAVIIERRTAASPRIGSPVAVLACLGLLIVLLHVSGAHATAQPGLMPVVILLLHQIAVVTWLASVLILVLPFWKTVQDDEPRARSLKALYRHAAVWLLPLLIVAGFSGWILAVVHVHGLAAVEHTAYGQSLRIKIGLVLILVIVSLYRYMRTLVALDRQTPGTRRAGLWFVLATEVTLILSIVMIAGHLAHLSPPDTSPFLNPQTYQLNAGDQTLTLAMQPVAGNTTDVRMEITVPDTLMQTGILAADYELYPANASNSGLAAEAVQVTANSYQIDAVFPVPGLWHFVFRLTRADGTDVIANRDFDLPGQPLVQDLRTWLSPGAVMYDMAGQLGFITGFILLLIYGWLTRMNLKGQGPRWLVVPALGGLLLGGYLILSVSLVKTYPTTYVSNPEPYTAASIARGQLAYLANCAECHGTIGQGDGPWAVTNRGRIPDLAMPHMDVHTDGEVYWWITHGIPSLDMTAVPESVSEADRWAVINYVRSLRHGVPLP